MTPKPPTNSSEPLVSVIIPTYNRAGLVSRALKSALGQTYSHLEILVVDDASTDNTREVVAGFVDSRVRYFCHGKNRGGGAARNTGVQQAHGEYLALLDSDDEWLPDKLQSQIPAMQAQKALFSYCQAVHMETGSEKIYPQRPYAGGNLLHFLMTEPGLGLAVPSIVIHRSLWAEFDENLPVHHDLDWIMRIFPGVAKVNYVAIPLVRVHLDAPFRIRDSRTRPLIDKVRPFLEKCARELEVEGHYQRKLIWGCALDALAQGNRSLARRILWQHRIFPSFFRKPHAWNVWWRCLAGGS